MPQLTLDQQVNAPVNAGQPKPTANLSVSQYLLRQLAEWGVKRIYGVLGDANLFLLDELAKQNAIRYIPCRHEGAAALMASAEAKLTGRIGVCLATSGPGIANLLNGLADAASDKAPMLAVTGQVETKKIGTAESQYIEQQQLASPICGASELLAHADALPDVLQGLMTKAIAQGIVSHLSVPKDMFRQQVHGVTMPYPKHLHQPKRAPDELVKQTAALLIEASRPVIYAGRGVSGAAGELRQLAEKLGAPVVATLPARPLFPNDHPQFVGGLGQAGSEAASTLLSECDTLLMLGATWWPDDYAPAQLNAKVVQIDAAAESIGMGHSLALGISGDLSDILPRLLKDIAVPSPQQQGNNASILPDRSAWVRRVSELKQAWKNKIEEEGTQDGTPIPPQCVMKTIADIAAENAVIAVDTGDHTLWFDRIWQAKADQRVLVSGSWRTLGFALPASIAAQLEQPDRQVIAIVGDGGFTQTGFEFQTAVELNVPIVAVVIDNGSYAMEKNRMVQAGMQTLGSVVRNPDFIRFAEACGGKGYRAETAQQLADNLRAALQERKPAIIAVHTADTTVPHTKI